MAFWPSFASSPPSVRPVRPALSACLAPSAHGDHMPIACPRHHIALPCHAVTRLRRSLVVSRKALTFVRLHPKKGTNAKNAQTNNTLRHPRRDSLRSMFETGASRIANPQPLTHLICHEVVRVWVPTGRGAAEAPARVTNCRLRWRRQTLRKRGSGRTT
ncbi:unnamed protein product [Protopolystoma xenopodis]|uniref:Uncharacterized protein n=1 Tax=Protopolystoma xenopodis TaxID=117903 RepID=A0A448XGY9_9PLAT|nr:unnamed protein product [Protopolystoma xenopodis]